MYEGYPSKIGARENRTAVHGRLASKTEKRPPWLLAGVIYQCVLYLIVDAVAVQPGAGCIYLDQLVDMNRTSHIINRKIATLYVDHRFL